MSSNTKVESSIPIVAFWGSSSYVIFLSVFASELFCICSLCSCSYIAPKYMCVCSYGQYKMNRCITIFFFKTNRYVCTATFFGRETNFVWLPLSSGVKQQHSLSLLSEPELWTKGKCGHLSNQTRKPSASVKLETMHRYHRHHSIADILYIRACT